MRLKKALYATTAALALITAFGVPLAEAAPPRAAAIASLSVAASQNDAAQLNSRFLVQCQRETADAQNSTLTSSFNQSQKAESCLAQKQEQQASGNFTAALVLAGLGGLIAAGITIEDKIVTRRLIKKQPGPV